MNQIESQTLKISQNNTDIMELKLTDKDFKIEKAVILIEIYMNQRGELM